MGVPRPKRLPRPSVKRPQIQSSVVELEIAKDVWHTGRKPRVIVTVMTHNSRLRGMFRGFCQKHGIHPTLGVDGKSVPVQDWGGTAAYDVTGSGEALTLLTQCDFVVDWHYCLSASVGHISGGTGPEKMRSSGRAAGTPKHYGPIVGSNRPTENADQLTAGRIASALARECDEQAALRGDYVI